MCRGAFYFYMATNCLVIAVTAKNEKQKKIQFTNAINPNILHWKKLQAIENKGLLYYT